MAERDHPVVGVEQRFVRVGIAHGQILRAQHRLAAVLGGVCLALAACDDGPGVPDPFAAPPTVSEFTFTPLQFALDGDAPTAEIPLAMNVRVTNAGASPDVRYFVRPEFGTETLAEGTLTTSGDGRYTVTCRQE